MTLLQVRNLSKSYGGVKAVDDVSFSVAAGEFLALIGPNGAGKSTCFNMLNGQIPANSGSILLEGREIVKMRPRQVWRLGVGRTFQVAATFGSMSVVENVQMALISTHHRTFSFWRDDSEFRRQEALELLEMVGMREQSKKLCSNLAYGDVKRVELAIALANKPRLLLMDEPTAGMAPTERNNLIALTKTLVVEQNIGVLFTEHSMDVVFRNADRMIVLARGKVIAEGDAATVRATPKVQEVYFGSGKTFEEPSSPTPQEAFAV
ncbi:ABC transporter ATP-binding protein [Eoetvoesiella caeni]